MLKQLSWLSSGRLIAAAIQASTIILLARFVQPSQLGLILSIIGVGAFLQMFFDLGVSTYVLREKAVGSMIAIQQAATIHAASCVALAGFGALLIIAAANFSEFDGWVFLPIAISVAADRHSDMRLNILLADGDSHRNILLLLERRAFTFILFLVLSTALDLDPTSSFAASLALASTISLFRTVRATTQVRLFTFIDRAILLQLLNATKTYWTNSVASQLRNLDAPLVLLGGGTTASGFYGFASRLVNPLRLVPDAVGNIFLPTAARQPYKISPFIRLGTAVLVAISFGLVLVAAIAPMFVPYIAGANYQGAVLPVQITCLGMIFGALSSVCSPILLGWGEGKTVATISVVCNLLALGLAYLLSVHYGATGAAIGLSSAFVLQAFLVIVQIIRFRSSQQPLADA
ncbi:lipopolysaccharide biosynthesis protein [Arthrobacter sp. MDT1-65]